MAPICDGCRLLLHDRQRDYQLHHLKEDRHYDYLLYELRADHLWCRLSNHNGGAATQKPDAARLYDEGRAALRPVAPTLNHQRRQVGLA